jgi:hypothetical protein
MALDSRASPTQVGVRPLSAAPVAAGTSNRVRLDHARSQVTGHAAKRSPRPHRSTPRRTGPGPAAGRGPRQRRQASGAGCFARRHGGERGVVESTTCCRRPAARMRAKPGRSRPAARRAADRLVPAAWPGLARCACQTARREAAAHKRETGGDPYELRLEWSREITRRAECVAGRPAFALGVRVAARGSPRSAPGSLDAVLRRSTCSRRDRTGLGGPGARGNHSASTQPRAKLTLPPHGRGGRAFRARCSARRAAGEASRAVWLRPRANSCENPARGGSPSVPTEADFAVSGDAIPGSV